MKITDFALIFIGVVLPIIIIVYVNVSFTIKAEEQEMYYQKLIDSAIQDATVEMKEVENEDAEIDYGYSGTEDKKVSVNTEIAANTFFNSLYNNLGIKGNDTAEKYLQMFVPVIAVVDYNGVQVSSIENYTKNGTNYIEHKVKPKRYYTLSYSIVRDSTDNYRVVWQGDSTVGQNVVSTHTIELTMDDYITHRGYYNNGISVGEIEVKKFYYEDDKNNSDLVSIGFSTTADNLKKTIVEYIKEHKMEIMANVLMQELSYATNAHNSYASNAGIKYSFSFPATTKEELYEYVNDIGIIAFVQGISVGNKYLNAKSYGISKLSLATRYYFSLPKDNSSKYNMNLYHKDINCLEYKNSIKNDIIPESVATKQQAASASVTRLGSRISGFYPCPVCRP